MDFAQQDIEQFTLNTATNVDALAAEPGVRWGIIYLVLSNSANPCIVTIDSDTTEIGTVALAANDAREFGDGTSVIIKANAVNEKLNFATSAVTLNGWGLAVRLKTG